MPRNPHSVRKGHTLSEYIGSHAIKIQSGVDYSQTQAISQLLMRTQRRRSATRQRSTPRLCILRDTKRQRLYRSVVRNADQQALLR